ncbi:MAG TPA: glycosyltransferase family 4 protein [Lacipirellulaceae bacterium]|jgi:glycosyltransferase involved in cell wall biosynthesis|nr:glycosyltransferase family 4 protein [Lacipirellulaceae bacterium]
MSSQPLLLVISQVYVPDPASVGQHIADVAETMVRRGYRVRVLTSRRGYDNPSEIFPARETRSGVDVVRLPFSSFGKRSLLHRVAGQVLFLLQAIVHGVCAPRLCKILVSTSPPMASIAAMVISIIRRVPISYWVMDLNPDQVVALRRVGANNIAVQALRWLNRRIFARASEVIVLDRFMAERIRTQYDVAGRMEIVPPWPHDEHVELAAAGNPFRAKYNPDGRFVVMYSGNHSLASPVTTVLEAARRLRDDARFRFMFIGGGHGKIEVDEAIATGEGTNLISLPYQPLEQLCFSLSAADVHLVTLGSEMVGIIHPCKVYGALAVGRPVIYVGPAPSHVSDLMERYAVGWQVQQGDVDGLVEQLRCVARLSTAERAELGQRAKQVIAGSFGKATLCDTFCDLIDPQCAADSCRSVATSEGFAA